MDLKKKDRGDISLGEALVIGLLALILLALLGVLG